VLLLVLVLAVVVATFFELDRLSAQMRAIDRINVELGTLLALQLDEETGLRGYAATGQLPFLQPYYRARPQIAQLLDALAKQLTSRPADARTLEHFSLLHNAWQRDVALPMVHQKGQLSNTARERVGKMLVDRMRADVATLEASNARLASATIARRRAVAYFAEVAILLCILVIAGVSYLMERRSAGRERAMFARIVEARDAATQMSDWRSRVIGMLAHDFKSMLGAVSAYAKLLEDFPERRADLQPYRGIRHATDQLARMVDEALLMARITSGNLNVKFEELEIWQVVNESTERYRADRSIRLSPSCATVIGDADYLMRVFDNLLSNAVKYSPAATGIDVEITQPGSDRVQISVRDEGKGIAEQDLPHLFDEYWRGSTEAKGTGSGIGLFIVKKIVDAHQGTIFVQSHPGAGTTVNVQLPSAGTAKESIA
jgi:signal transduction histidine kinase